MTNQITYEGPFGPNIRIGMLQKQDEIQFSLIGTYKIVTKEGKTLKTFDDKSGILQCTVVQSQPAQLKWRIVIARLRDHETALVRAEVTERTLAINHTEILEVGSEVVTTTGRRFDARGFWLCTEPFSSIEEAREARSKLPDSSRYDILPVRMNPSSGTLKLTSESNGESLEVNDSIELIPKDATDSRVVLHDVIVGISYHWRHKERQKLRGNLRIIIDNEGKLTAINILPLEVYLVSVNSSEMMSACHDEFLKAQTIAARNIVLANMHKHHYADDFDLCADDHCQCYRGSSRETEKSRKAVLSTLSEVLVSGHELCDTRYSKMCGGLTADFDRVWYGEPIEYLVGKFDGDPDSEDIHFYPADTEPAALKFIESSPDVYCNTTRGRISQSLKYSAPYFRWNITYSRQELEKLINRFPEYRVGEFLDFEPLSRSPSGRLEYILIKGTGGEVIIGKEFEIRRVLSPTFLYSACFIWDIQRNNGKVESVTLHGAGWGHGVGLCQIGAAMMAQRGKKYEEILAHYYPQTSRATIYEEKYTRKSLKEQLGETDFRPGDACYEFFNCYAVAQCPIHLKNIRLEARKENDEFVFEPVNAPDINLKKMKIECDFLDFEESSARPKKGTTG